MPPRVISLVGMTPDSVRTVGESRVISQQLTGAEERLAWARPDAVHMTEAVPVGVPIAAEPAPVVEGVLI